MGLKAGVKQILVNKQHKKYEAALLEKKMSYDDWIRKQEEKMLVEKHFVHNWRNCLKNAKNKDLNEGSEMKNEGFLSKMDDFCKRLDFCRGEDENDEKWVWNVLNLSNRSKITPGEVVSAIENSDSDLMLFQLCEGEVAKVTFGLFCEEFTKNKNLIVIYGDEDVKNDGKREKPWFKPDWSPDTFLDSFYFGNLVAVRNAALKEALPEAKKYLEESGAPGDVFFMVYLLLAEVIRTGGGFQKHEELFSQAPVCHIPEVVFHTTEEGYNHVKDYKLPEAVAAAIAAGEKNAENEKTSEPKETAKVSVIIPSKDNPKVLFHCISSLVKRTEPSCSYEIILVDNGSNDENKRMIEEQIRKTKESAGVDILYHYEPMVFNFSTMCNKGGRLATGEFLLFLNDDMEIIQEDWLSLLLKKAALPYVGSVGAKLLYPDSDIIQHAGITNLRVGPAHKLQFLSDAENHYYGKNRGVHNMLGATGACLLVKKEIFEQVGGFSEELAVAFNDVDLCYKIYEAGYYNVVRNDVKLYHHESLSRGKDGESPEKQKRLLREKDILYMAHRELYGKDPFYHKYLTNDMLESEYAPALRYQVTLDMPWAQVKIRKELPADVREDACVVIGMEAAMDIYKWKYGIDSKVANQEPDAEEMGYYFQGYSFVIGSDNACYEKVLLLENTRNKQIVEVPLDIRYRPDIRKNLKDQLNVDLTGYAAKVRLADLPKGDYRFGMLVKDRCSRLKLVNWSSWTLQVPEDK